MKTASVILCIVLAACQGSVAQTARKGSWDLVVQLPQGIPISLQLDRRRIQCRFVEADEERIRCRPDSARRPSEEYEFPRTIVRQVRVEHPGASALLGATLGGGIGAIVGRNVHGSEPLTPKGGELLLGGTMMVVGGVVGRDCSFIHGRIVFER